MLSMLGKNFSRQHFITVFLFFPDNRLCQFMQIVFFGDNLHEISKPISGFDISCKLSPKDVKAYYLGKMSSLIFAKKNILKKY